jgi:DNA replication protein DnaC
MIETTLSQLRQLKLTGMASALQTQREQPGTYEGLSFAERLQLLVDHEDQERHQRKQDRLTRAAQFKLKAYRQRHRLSVRQRLAAVTNGVIADV